MKETTVEVKDSKVTVGPSTKKKIAVGASQIVIGLVVTTVAGVVTNFLNGKVENLINPDQKS